MWKFKHIHTSDHTYIRALRVCSYCYYTKKNFDVKKIKDIVGCSVFLWCIHLAEQTETKFVCVFNYYSETLYGSFFRSDVSFSRTYLSSLLYQLVVFSSFQIFLKLIEVFVSWRLITLLTETSSRKIPTAELNYQLTSHMSNFVEAFEADIRFSSEIVQFILDAFPYGHNI